MPRVSRKQADLNRQAITAEAARLYRERGFAGVGIPEITRAAGLTHGSFYGHFSSKDELAAEAAAAALYIGLKRWDERKASRSTPAEQRAAMVEGYLSRSNRDTPSDACPLAALAGDVARQSADAPVRRVFNEGVGRVIEKLMSVHVADAPCPAEQKAVTDVATLVGALILARATQGSPLSEKFLTLVTAEMTGRPPVPAKPTPSGPA